MTTPPNNNSSSSSSSNDKMEELRAWFQANVSGLSPASALVGRTGLGLFGTKNPQWYPCLVKAHNKDDGTLKVQWTEDETFTKRLPVDKFKLNNKEEDEDKAWLIFLIDRTGSMGSWIQAVRQVLPFMVHGVALTNVFCRIGILTYSDYDLKAERVITCSNLCRANEAAEVKELEDFAASIPCEGGAGAPEAFKTALLALASIPMASPRQRLHVLHLTDAPPHCLAGKAERLDREGQKEQAHLGADLFEWRRVVEEVTAAHPTLCYTALTTNLHPLYCHLAHVTGGSVHPLPGRDPNASNIRQQLGRIMNGWLGLPDTMQERAVFADNGGNAGLLDANATEEQVASTRVVQIEHREDNDVDLETVKPPKCPVLSATLLSALQRMRRDGAFREHVISEMQSILESDIMALTVSPVLGKIYRELCKARADPRRDEMIEVMNKAKAKISNPQDREVLDEWLKDSYNAKAEIDASLLDFMKANETHGLLRFVPENDDLCAQQVVHLLARGDKQATATIRAILSRMYVDEKVVLPRVGAPDKKEGDVTSTPAVAGEDSGDAEAHPITETLQYLSSQTHQNFKTALVVLPPQHLADKADTMRSEHDKAYGRWMPHMTLLFPFHDPDQFPKVIEAVEAVLNNPSASERLGFPSPFALDCRKVSWFPGRKAVVHVSPNEKGLASSGAKPSMERLYHALLALFPNMKRGDRNDFHAHMTLGQVAGKDAEETAKTFQALWDNDGADRNAFEVGEFHLIAHLEGEAAYKVIHTFQLPPTSKTKVAASRKAPTELPFQLPAGSILADEPAAAKKSALDEADDSAEEDTEPPLPLQAIPMNLPVGRFFELVMHTVAPGTKLTWRYAALLAMHAIRCGSVLSGMAKEYLRSIRGRWINWKRKEEDETLAPEVPENFGGNFLFLLTSPDVVEYSCTPEEHKFAKFLIKVLTALRFFHQLEVEVKLLDHESADGTYPDHSVVCSECRLQRPLSLISKSGVCGYCLQGTEGVPAMDPSAQFQPRCHDCGSFYARRADAYVPGYSKCYGCRGVGTDGSPSPCATCQDCGNQFVLHYNTEKGLPGGRCGSCASGCPPRRLAMREFVSLAHKVFPEQEHFLALAAKIGMAPVTVDDNDSDETRAKVVGSLLKGGFTVSTSVAEAALMLEEANGNLPEEADPIPCRGKVTFRDQKVENADEVWAFVSGVMDGTAKPLESECSVCMGVPDSDNGGGRLIPACGRKGCTQRVCADCSRAWYGMNQPGKLIHPRSCLCQFCARVPAAKATRRTNPMLMGLAQHIRENPLEQDSCYAWCQRCFNPVLLANRDCVAAGDEQLPELDGYTCNDCRHPREGNTKDGGGDAVSTRACPACAVPTEKISGCNHITCMCGTHWCWACGVFHADNAREVYAHLDSEHGGYFDFRVDGDAEDDEEDY